MKQIITTRDAREAKLKFAYGWIVRIHLDKSDVYLAPKMGYEFGKYENKAEFVCIEM